MLQVIKTEIARWLKKAGVTGAIELSPPPQPAMGDLMFACFGLAKERGKSPNEIAKELASNVKGQMSRQFGGQANVFDEVKAVGPYVNFFIDGVALAEGLLKEIGEEYGQSKIGKKKKYLVEYGCPNPMKAFHLGHLRNLITGESVARILDNAGYKVLRVNYQGDIGLHIAKSLYGILQNQKSKIKNQKSFDEIVQASLHEQIAYLGARYADGAQAYETDENAKKEILEINKKVYAKDESIFETYKIGRAWSLEYFETIYARLGAHFDELYFESEMWERGLEIVRVGVKKGIFKESNGAIIFPGSKYGLHDRVFITSEGNPTYEAKDLALSERRFKKYKPDKIIHVVGKEQSEYFKVVFKALEHTLSESRGKEYHLPGGYLLLKEGKMSSRTGNVITGDALIEQASAAVAEIMKDREMPHKDEAMERVAMAAVKYAILKVGVSDDIAFDMKSSVSFEGDSGPYLLYIVARINSILKKTNHRPGRGPARRREKQKNTKTSPSFKFQVSSFEKNLLLQLSAFPEITSQAAADLDPSKIAHYLFHLAQTFNSFYHECPVLEAEDGVRNFRVRLIQKVEAVMARGLSLLGVETVPEM